jgi:hypothetical protein
LVRFCSAVAVAAALVMADEGMVVDGLEACDAVGTKPLRPNLGPLLVISYVCLTSLPFVPLRRHLFDDDLLIESLSKL